MIRSNPGGSSGGSDPVNEAVYTEALQALLPLIDFYEQVEGTKKNAQDVLTRLASLRAALEEKRCNPGVCTILRQLLDCLDTGNFGGVD